MTSARTSRLGWLAVVLGGALIASACGTSAGSATASAGPPESAPASPAPTVEPSAAASPDAPAVGELCAVGMQPCQIEAGTYATTPFVPEFTFAITDTWMNDRNYADGGGISTELGGLFWTSGVSSGIVDEAEVSFESTIEGLAGHLRSFDGFTVTEGEPTTIGGEPATVLDVLTNDTLARGLILIEEDAFNLGPGEAARFYLLEIDGVLVTFVVEAWMAADFDAVSALLEPVLESVAWS